MLGTAVTLLQEVNIFFSVLGVPNAHRRKLILVIKTHWSSCKLVLWDHLSSQGTTVL